MALLVSTSNAKALPALLTCKTEKESTAATAVGCVLSLQGSADTLSPASCRPSGHYELAMKMTPRRYSKAQVHWTCLRGVRNAPWLSFSELEHSDRCSSTHVRRVLVGYIATAFATVRALMSSNRFSLAEHVLLCVFLNFRKKSHLHSAALRILLHDLAAAVVDFRL